MVDSLKSANPNWAPYTHVFTANDTYTFDYSTLVSPTTVFAAYSTRTAFPPYTAPILATRYMFLKRKSIVMPEILVADVSWIVPDTSIPVVTPPVVVPTPVSQTGTLSRTAICRDNL